MVVAAIHGFILALALILPIGMQNGFILTQGAVHRSWVSAMPAILAAAICDTLLVALAVVGVSAAVFHVTWLRYLLGLMGIMFLAYLGWTTWNSGSQGPQESSADPWSPGRQVRFAVSVSLLNPHALMDTLAVIGASAVAYPSWPEKLVFGASCALVSWLWFLILAVVGHVIGRRTVQHTSMKFLQRLSAVMMWASGVYLIYVIYTFK